MKLSLQSMAVLAMLTLCMSVRAQKDSKNKARQDEAASLPAVVVRDPVDPATLDLFYGAGGREHAPDPSDSFTFVKEDLDGSNPKFSVQDEKGVQWKVKLGQESRSETAATRMLWAAGYFVDEDYYLTNLKVQGLSKLSRGQSQVSADGTVQGVRLERNSKDIEKVGNWDWFHNQCGSTKEMNGLRVMMAFVNNWDLKAINNSLEEADGQRRCAITDLGATFGKTGNVFTRSKGVAKDYASSKFISRITRDSVDLAMHSRPFFLTVFDLPNYRTRTRMQKITKHIPRADARSVGQKLALLSQNQIRDCFRAAGYSPEEVEEYSKTVQERIAELNAL